MQIRVYYEDTDFSGIVYHANYLRFMERGRSNYLRLLGADQHALFAEAESETPGFAFVVRVDAARIPEAGADGRSARRRDLAAGGEGRLDHAGAGGAARRHVLVKAKVKVAFISGGQAQPIPKALRPR